MKTFNFMKLLLPILIVALVTIPANHVKAATVPKDNLTYFSVNMDKLRYSMSSERVYQLKSFLASAGYEITDMNYSFDKQTKSYVIKFQKDKNLKPDGIVGKDTFVEINKEIKEQKIVLPVFALEFDKDIPSGNWIIINKTNNTLYWMDNNEVIKEYPVATGSKPSYTPEGKYMIVKKTVNPSWGGGGYAKPIAGGKANNPLGKRWMGLNIKGGGSYGIHGNADEQSIGTFASHGCIRMHNADVVELFPDVPKDTPVWIGTEEKLESMGVTLSVIN